MGDAVSIQLINLDGFMGELAQLSDKVRGANIVTALQAGALVIQNAAKEKVHAQLNTTGQATGTLARSIHMEVADSSANSAEVDVGTDVVYAAIHEFGGVITPKKAKMLHWISPAGEDIFAHSVHIPARPYLRPAMDENRDAVQAEIEATLKDLLGAE